mmetsp:Transcript_32603/g.79811  ORF Transcript_32603/g.79811 Transcript_32603/m.79811 type:complete len:99 (+) Transcript_32603:208-504(+)
MVKQQLGVKEGRVARRSPRIDSQRQRREQERVEKRAHHDTNEDNANSSGLILQQFRAQIELNRRLLQRLDDIFRVVECRKKASRGPAIHTIASYSATS